MILYFDPLLNNSTDSPLRTTAIVRLGGAVQMVGGAIISY